MRPASPRVYSPFSLSSTPQGADRASELAPDFASLQKGAGGLQAKVDGRAEQVEEATGGDEHSALLDRIWNNYR